MKSQLEPIMKRKLFIAAIVSGCLCSYVAILYGLISIVVRINNANFLSLAK
jgi:hypothetical protein